MSFRKKSQKNYGSCATTVSKLLRNLTLIFIGSLLMIGNAFAEQKLRIVCEGSLNTWDQAGQFDGSFRTKVFFSLDFEAQKLVLDGGYYDNREYELAPNQGEIYRAESRLLGDFIHGKKTVAVYIELNRFSGKGIQAIQFEDGSTHFVFSSESGCEKVEAKF